MWYALQLARADYLRGEDTEASLRAGIRVAPDDWRAYMRLAQFDRGHAHDLLGEALRLNPYNAQADIELALQYEADGDNPQAEKMLLAAYSVDNTYLPRWSLANYYFRRGDVPQFWAWARSAAAMPAEDIRPLLELCWRATENADAISAAILNHNPGFLRQYVAFLLAKDRPRAAADAATGLVTRKDEDSAADGDRGLLFSILNRLVQADDPEHAVALWHSLQTHAWISADAGLPYNPDFAREPLPVSFDWQLPKYVGLHSWPGPSGLETELSGEEPEDCLIAEQMLPLSSGDYRLKYAYRTVSISPGAGLHWEILEAGSGKPITLSADLSSDAPQKAATPFTIPPGYWLVRLRLVYRRSPGTTRISGRLIIASTRVEVVPKPGIVQVGPEALQGLADGPEAPKDIAEQSARRAIGAQDR
jgi:tetratricopeptide (TPR) repeat protein